MVRAQAVHELGRPVELLAANAVLTLVPLQVEVTARGAGLPEPFDPGPVTRIAAGADEIIERQRQRLAQRGERGRVAVDQGSRANAFRLGGQHVLERVVVGAGLEAHLVAGQAMVPGQHVGLDELERVPEVGPAVDVRDRGAEVDVLRVHRNLLEKRGAPTCGHESRPLGASCRTSSGQR